MSRYFNIILIFSIIYSCQNNQEYENNENKTLDSGKNDLDHLNRFNNEYKKKIDDSRVFFTETIELIKQYSDTASWDRPGPWCKEITERVYRIIYVDNTYSQSDRFYMTCFLAYYMHKCSETYRNKIINEYIKKNSKVYSEPIYTLPQLFCHYCSDSLLAEVVSRVDLSNIKLDSFSVSTAKKILYCVDKYPEKSLDGFSNFSKFRLNHAIRFYVMAKYYSPPILESNSSHPR